MGPTMIPLRVTDIRRRNEKIVLRLVHSSGERGISQSKVVQTTGLKAPTIFRIFTSLEEMGYIEPLEGGTPQNRKGRRPLAYTVRRDVFYCIGIEFWVEFISLGVFDFRGASIYSKMIPLTKDENSETVVAKIVALVNEAITVANIGRERILGIGLGAPGQVNLDERTIVAYPRITGMSNFPIASILEEQLGLSVFLHNNCSVIAQSEYRYGPFGQEASMFMFLLRAGVNGAFIDGGKIFLNPHGTTIEMGHISVDYDGPTCVCGARGCLEAFMTALDAQSPEGTHWLFDHLDLNASSSATILDLASGYLVSAVQTVSRLFSPEAFLIIAKSEPLAQALAQRLENRYRREISSFDNKVPRFIGRAYDMSLAQRGAANLAIDTFLS
ncbi:MAG: ROK family protein [Rectinema sp.]